MNENDKNIYVNYEKYENGKYINPVSVEWDNNVFSLSTMTKEEILNMIKSIDSDMTSLVATGDVKRINRAKELKNINDLLIAKNNNSDNFVNKEEKHKVKSIHNVNNKDFKNLGKRVAAAVVAVVVLATSLVSCTKNKNTKGNENITTVDLNEEDALETAKKTVSNSMEKFSLLAKKYQINGKEYFISAEEWLSAYIYANSYDLTIQELISILDGNPDFYSKMSDNYRLFNEKMMTFNIISEEPVLSKDFFVNEEAYNIYLNYFNTFKKAQKENNAENKHELEELTKEMYGLTYNTNTLESIYESNPGVASIIGHTLTVPSMMMNLISQETYDNAMGIYKYDKNGNLIENHGPIEIATCNDIEAEVLDRLETVIITSGRGKEDELQPWFDSLNEKYQVKDIVSTKDALVYIQEIRTKKYNETINSNYSGNTNTNKETVVVDPSTLTEEEKKQAEQEANKEFEEQYKEEQAKEDAYGAGMSDAMSAIESVLARARQNEASANAISSSEITSIGNNLKNSYTGKYKTEYSNGVDVAVNYGISELESIKSQYKNFKEETNTETKEEIIEDNHEEDKDYTNSNPTENIEEEIIIDEEIISQEELDNLNNQEKALVRTR